VSPWNFLVNFTWRYMSEVDQLTTSAVKIDIDEFHWFDLSGQWDATDYLAIIAGVNNLTDKDPPITQNGVTQRNNGNTYPGVYDHLGQYWFLRANVHF
jgi:outer membrane receptor protein involved in Fe transport